MLWQVEHVYVTSEVSLQPNALCRDARTRCIHLHTVRMEVFIYVRTCINPLEHMRTCLCGVAASQPSVHGLCCW